MRQSGKTTLVKRICPGYLSFDDDALVGATEAGQWDRLLAQPRPLALDEVQKAPRVFSRLKLWIDERRRPGQFVLTGSVRFLSRRAIRESLTGRTALLELLPLTIAEAHGRPLANAVSRLLKLDHSALERLMTDAWCSPARLESYCSRGGMPGICFHRSEGVRRHAWDSHLDTVLARDLQLVYATRITVSRMKTLFAQIAAQQGEPLPLARLARILGASDKTTAHLLHGFESLFLIRRHGKGWYCEDMGLAAAACKSSWIHDTVTLRRWVFGELLAQLQVHHANKHEFGEYRTRGGAFIPFVVAIDGAVLLFTVDAAPAPSEKSLKSLGAYRDRGKRAVKIALHTGDEGWRSPRGIWCLPARWIA
jgi:predicted AAA+ superfamily ATPase